MDYRQAQQPPTDSPQRPVCILTSGPLSPDTLASLEQALTGHALPCDGASPGGGAALPERLRWDALHTGLSAARKAHWGGRLAAAGLTLNFPDTAAGPGRGPEPDGQPKAGEPSSTQGMYAARKAVLRHREAVDSEYILCWLDADLSFRLLKGTARGTEPYPDGSWLHQVGRYAAQHPQVDIATGDVVGDAPVPASSTLRTNLQDLAARCAGERVQCGIGRWAQKDPAYDLSEQPRRCRRPFALLTEGPDTYRPEQLADSLLWRGTLARPLVYSRHTAQNPHRPPWVRGGLTVVLNPQVMAERYLDLRCAGIAPRRGDSFWMLRCMERGWKAAHFPHPLLHRRGSFVGSPDQLLMSFAARGVEDCLGAAALKAAAAWLSAHRTGRLEQMLSAGVADRRRRVLRNMRRSQALIGQLPPLPALTLVRRAIAELQRRIAAISPGRAAAEMAPQISDYLPPQAQQ